MDQTWSLERVVLQVLCIDCFDDMLSVEFLTILFWSFSTLWTVQPLLLCYPFQLKCIDVSHYQLCDTMSTVGWHAPSCPRSSDMHCPLCIIETLKLTLENKCAKYLFLFSHTNMPLTHRYECANLKFTNYLLVYYL